MQGCDDNFKGTLLKRTSSKNKCLHLASIRHEMCTPSVSDLIYHKLSQGAASCTLNGKYVNVMLEIRLPNRSSTGVFLITSSLLKSLISQSNLIIIKMILSYHFCSTEVFNSIVKCVLYRLYNHI